MLIYEHDCDMQGCMSLAFFLNFGVTNAISPFIDCANFLLVAGSEEAESAIQDNLPEFCASFLAAYDSGDLVGALEEGQAGWKNWVKGLGKSTKRKGKSLFMPLRLLLTGKLHGPDIGAAVVLLYQAGTTGVIAPEVSFVTIDERVKMLREINWETLSKDHVVKETASTV